MIITSRDIVRQFLFLEVTMGFKEDLERFNKNHKVKTINIKGNKFNYLLSGKGEKKVVFFTGGSGLYEGFYKHIELLEKKYNVLAFDYPIGIKNVYDLVNSIADLLNSLNFNKCFLIGESVGGLLLQLFIKQKSEMVEGGVLVNTGVINKSTSYDMKKEVVDGIKSVIRTVQTTPAFILKPAIIKKSVKKIKEDFEGSIDSIYAKEYVSYFIEKIDKEKAISVCNIALNFVESISFHKEDFKEISNRVTIISTNDDEVFDERSKAELKKLFINSKNKYIKSGGHASFLFKYDEYISMLDEIII